LHGRIFERIQNGVQIAWGSLNIIIQEDQNCSNAPRWRPVGASSTEL